MSKPGRRTEDSHYTGLDEGIGLLSHYSAERLYSHQTTEPEPDKCSHFTFSSGFFRSLNYIFFQIH